MIVVYMYCPCRPESLAELDLGTHDAGYLTAYDYEGPSDLDLETVRGSNESLWMVPRPNPWI